MRHAESRRPRSVERQVESEFGTNVDRFRKQTPNGRRALAPWRLAAAMIVAAAIVALPIAAHAQSTDEGAATSDAEVWPNYGPAQDWRYLFGPGMEGALRLSKEASERSGRGVGHFVMSVWDRGYFQGVYNLREDGRSAVGVFWADGAPLNGPIAGVIDIGAAPVGPAMRPTEARITFISGDVIVGDATE